MTTDPARWAIDRQTTGDPTPVTAGWEALTPAERGARVEWLRLLRWDAAATVTDWVAESGAIDRPPIDPPPAAVRDALAHYRDRGADLEAVADWAMDQ